MKYDQAVSHAGVLEDGSRPRRAQSSARRRISALFLIVILLPLYWYLQPLPGSTHVHTQTTSVSRADDFDWASIRASTTLEYVSCYTEKNPRLQCAKLILPLDPVNASETRTVSLAVIRLPAPVDIVSKRYGGAFIVNSGGPGEAGVDSMLFGGAQTQRFVSDMTGLTSSYETGPLEQEGGLVYDVICFDARGIGRSEPAFHVFHSLKPFHEYRVEKRMIGNDFKDRSVLKAHLAHSKAYSKALRRAFDDERNGDIGRYIGTTSVVGDLLGLVNAHGEWRDRQFDIFFRSKAYMDMTIVQQEQVLTRSTLHGRGGEKLNFWGISYGTFIGQMFASMHPRRYNRMVLDGVVSPERSINPEIDINPGSADGITRRFADECYLAGPNKCHLWSKDGARGILTTLYGFIEKLRLHGPLASVVNDAPVTVSASDVTAFLFNSWYHSKVNFPVVDRTIWEAMQGNLTSFVGSRKYSFSTEEEFLLNDYPDLEAAIACIDIPPRVWSNYTQFETMEKVINSYYKESEQLGGAAFASHGKPQCAELRDIELPKHLRFEGPWGFKSSAKDVASVSPKPSPILFVSNHHDPATGLKLAREARQLFPGSGLVVNDVPGHAQNHWPSECVTQRVRRYAATGEVDGENEVWCAQEGHPVWEKIST